MTEGSNPSPRDLIKQIGATVGLGGVRGVALGGIVAARLNKQQNVHSKKLGATECAK